MKKLFLLISATIALSTYNAQAQTARVMAIHNSADPTIDTVDVWLVNGNASQKLVDNFAFRQSTGFINAPAGTPIRLAFALKNSNVITDTLLGFGFNLTANQTYVLLAQGNVGSGFTPAKPFGIQVITPTVERISGQDSVSLTMVHGSTDAPGVNLIVRKGNNELVVLPTLSFGEHINGAKLATDNYFIDIEIASTSTLLQTLNVPLSILGLNDSAVVVFASGFVNPTNNNNGAAFGVFAALSNGNVIQIPLQNTFSIQVFHNSADTAAKKVDVWLIDNTTSTNTKILSDFAFRTATPFVELPAAQDISIGVSAPGSTTILYQEDIGEVPGGVTVFAVATGVLDTGKFESNPNGNDISFMINGIEAIPSSPESGKVALNVYHGATDAPAVDVKVSGGPTLFSNLTYGESGEDYISVDPQTYTLNITPTGTNDIVATYSAPLNDFRDSALVVVASGFLSPNSPAGRDAGEPFGLYAITKSGRVITLPFVTGLRQVRSSVESKLYPNPASTMVHVNADANIKGIHIIDITGKNVFTMQYNEANKTIEIPLNGFNKGLYFLNIETEKGTANQKLLVE